MKKLSTFLSCVGFVIQYLVPIAMFGDIVPYTQESVGKCLTGMGYVAIGLVLFFAYKKFNGWLLQKPKSIKRAILLCIPAFVVWLAVDLGINAIITFLLTFAKYWSEILIFIILGSLCKILSEAVVSGEETKKQKEEGAEA